LDCGGKTPLWLHDRLAPDALELTVALALAIVEEKR